jgi:hypothetical protein
MREIVKAVSRDIDKPGRPKKKSIFSNMSDLFGPADKRLAKNLAKQQTEEWLVS